MSDHLPVLKVRLFGGFSASYGEIPVSFGRNTTTKAMKLLQILLYHGDTGISRDKLLDELYGREELADAANNLRVTAHRLKKIIVDAGLPSHNYINIKKGIYRWDAPMPTEVDAHQFVILSKDVQACTDKVRIRPSEHMMQQFEQMSSRLNYKPQELGDIKERLKDDDVRGGAFYCSLPSFRDSYRLVSRIIERNGQSVYLMLCSITNGKGMPMDKPDKLEALSGELQNTIQQCLRKGDSFTKYSPSQFLILLVGTNKENCSMIFDRIQRYFSREHKSWKQYLDYFVSSVAEVDRQDSPIQFNTENKTW